MKKYLLSIYQPDGPAPGPEVLEPIMREVEAVNTAMREEGAWVFAGGLNPPGTATVVRDQGGEALMTDGPYVQGAEHVGGFTVIQAPDHDAALEWGHRLARATTLPVEVRPMESGSCG
ncbi:YciI family protein [Streptomonospora sp. S1-112]|uniref:YciI family protein n=1 Tax=Streptomonospora mangrovi TaxID=2883123 RepID=A0A9X3SCT2_9ACTN|nr:YciI family protein [Streptomonospora mangrovi]MDA0563112.1 YciI family protein [Streptomonospora mangrovi]